MDLKDIEVVNWPQKSSDEVKYIQLVIDGSRKFLRFAEDHHGSHNNILREFLIGINFPVSENIMYTTPERGDRYKLVGAGESNVDYGARIIQVSKSKRSRIYGLGPDELSFNEIFRSQNEWSLNYNI